MISFEGIEFEEAKRDESQSEYRMGDLFKAWAAYSGILVKLAGSLLQGELAISLSIYAINL